MVLNNKCLLIQYIFLLELIALWIILKKKILLELLLILSELILVCLKPVVVIIFSYINIHFYENLWNINLYLEL